MNFQSFSIYGWSYISDSGWVSWGLMGTGSVLPAPPKRFGAQIFPLMSMQL